MRKNRAFSILHISGLSIGLSLSFIMLLIVQHEFAFDKQNKKLDRIYRVYTDIRGPNLRMFSAPYPLAEKLEKTLPEVEKTANIIKIRPTVEIGNHKITDAVTYSVEPEIFDILTIPVIRGKNSSPLSPNSVIISKSFVKTWFDDTDVLGKFITIRNMGKSYTLTISAVIEDFPETSTLRCDIMVPAEIAKEDLNRRYKYRGENAVTKWISINWLETFVLLREQADFATVNSKVRLIKGENSNSGPEMIYNLEPYSSVHLNSNYDNWKPDTVSRNNVLLFFILSIMILLIACINYAILVNFQFFRKSTEIGIRKVFGAGRKEIMYQLFTESILYSMLTFPITVIMISLFNNYFAELLNVSMPADYYLNFVFLVIILLITLLSGIIPVFYTAFKFSSLTPGLTFNIGKPQTIKHAYGQKILLTFQLMIFVSLIFVAIVVYDQISYFKKKDLGFSIENVTLIKLNSDENKFFNMIKSELSGHPGILFISGASNLPPAAGGAFVDVPSNNPENKVSSTIFNIDPDFPDAMGMDFIYDNRKIAGRTQQADRCFIVNESAYNNFNAEANKTFNSGKDKIVGVVKDFNYFTLEKPEMSVLMKLSQPGRFEYMVIKHTGDEANVVNIINEIWRKIIMSKPEILYYDDYFAQTYKNEYKFAAVITHATVFSFITATLGLLGLALFVVKNKSHEIKIRRILGANLIDINKVILKQFAIVLFVASITGVVTGLYLVDEWLYSFYYRITPSVLHYLIPALISLTTVSLSILIFTSRLVLSNKILTTRYE